MVAEGEVDLQGVSETLRELYLFNMDTLAEIKAAAEALSLEQKRELLLFLVVRLCGIESLPELRKFARDQIKSWIDEDEADMRRFRHLT